MEKVRPGLSFLYGGKPFDTVAGTAVSDGLTEYDLDGGLTVTNRVIRHDDYKAVEWVNTFENRGNVPSDIVSELKDTDCVLPFPKDEPCPFSAYMPSYDDNMQIYTPLGSSADENDFSIQRDEIVPGGRFAALMLPGDKRQYHPYGARSSDGHAPFFQFHRRNEGYIMGIGWSGQWSAEFERTDEGILVKAGLEKTNFRVNPGERFRTASVLIMHYEGSDIDGSNKWRRLIKDRYSLVGKEGRDKEGPCNICIWGGMSTKRVLERLAAIRDAKIPFDNVWMDAGWYGMDNIASPDEFSGEWSDSTGDWRVNPYRHPDNMQDIKRFISENGMRFMLWFEPERVIHGNPITKEHPEYFINLGFTSTLLLNLGRPDAWQYCFDMLSERIRTLGISFYRQDFNIPPSHWFNPMDAEDRIGMTEILHINGLYRLWDALLAEFPHLMIDNCSSGGRRIDVETLRRSIPLWRSDAQCSANCPQQVSQMHAVNYGRWMPYSGTGVGRKFDKYSFRSAYSPSIGSSIFAYESDPVITDPEKLNEIKERYTEFMELRPYFSCDMYPLTRPAYQDDIWSATQYNRPEEDDGVIIAFRRENSSYSDALFKLYGLSGSDTYVFTDKDSGETDEFTGSELLSSGLAVHIDEKRSSRVILYRKKKKA